MITDACAHVQSGGETGAKCFKPYEFVWKDGNYGYILNPVDEYAFMDVADKPYCVRMYYSIDFSDAGSLHAHSTEDANPARAIPADTVWFALRAHGMLAAFTAFVEETGEGGAKT